MRSCARFEAHFLCKLPSSHAQALQVAGCRRQAEAPLMGGPLFSERFPFIARGSGRSKRWRNSPKISSLLTPHGAKRVCSCRQDRQTDVRPSMCQRYPNIWDPKPKAAGVHNHIFSHLSAGCSTITGTDTHRTNKNKKSCDPTKAGLSAACRIGGVQEPQQ